MPGNPTIKHTQITRAGYEYQDLVGIEVLMRFYRDKNLFDWIELESSDPSVKALDDVIAKRKDGSLEFTQVKFTVDGDKYELDWEWLLEASEAGTSMLAKWASSYKKAKALGPIHSARLATNRNPSASFSRCLLKERVQLENVDAELRVRIEAVCGGTEDAAAFFKDFAFQAGMPDLIGYETAVKAQIVPSDTDNAGWLLLREAVREWAIRKKSPPPDGKILREHIVSLISKRRPKPLRQDFFVPDNYTPPSASFDSAVRARISDDRTPITILWGTPGRGKSTYLSYLAESMQSKGEVVIRHHYFLSAEDASANRMSFVDVAASLYDQLYTRHADAYSGVTDNADSLGAGLKIAGANLARSGKRLFLIVDGLDHVYRDTQRTDMLNHLFGALLPLPENVSLIVGTQRVAEAHLPHRLLLASQEVDWVEIPPMDKVAVHKWVRAQDSARPFLLTWDNADRRDEEIDRIAAELFRISHGHPLYLIYALESLLRPGKSIDVDDIKALPPCPDGDIRTYYKGLWLKLSPGAKDVLHALAGSDFFWPSLGIRQCIGDYSEIAFMLEPRYSGMMPFHASLFAWVKERPDHGESYALLLMRIVDWLHNEAPPYWQWGWLWLTEAKSGNTALLMAGVMRSWAIESLAQGWPDRQIVNILRAAERIAFDSGNLAETVRTRALKTRVSNAREFQMYDFGLFRSVALSIARNNQQALNLLDDIEDLSDTDLTYLALYGPKEVREELLEACFQEVVRRINTWVELQHRRQDDFRALLDQMLMMAAASAPARIQRVLKYLTGFKSPVWYINRFIELLGNAFNLDGLLAVRKLLKANKWIEQRRSINALLLSSALWRGVPPASLLVGPPEEMPPFVAAWKRHADPTEYGAFFVPPAPENLPRERTSPTDFLDFKQFYQEAFWVSLANALRASGEFSSVYPPLVRGTLGFVDIALDCLESLASEVAKGTIPLAFSAPYLAAADVAPIPFGGNNEKETSMYRGFRDALALIAFGLHVWGCKPISGAQISAREMEVARSSSHWEDELWVSRNVESGQMLLDSAGALALLNDVRASLESRVSDFSERGQQWTRCAALAELYGLADAESFAVRASNCAIAYGHHKDLGALDMLDAIETLHPHDPSRTRNWLDRITPIIDKITEFTDGDETDYVRLGLITTIAETDIGRLPVFYAHHISIDEWRYADRCLREWISAADLTSPAAAALAGTILDAKTITALDERANTEPIAKELLNRQMAFLGGRPTEPKEHFTPEGELREDEKQAISQDPTKYGASNFAKVAAAVGHSDFHYAYRRKFLQRWLDHWVTEGKGVAALKSVSKFFAAGERTYEVEEMLDDAFEASLRLEGGDAAYPWLVRAHVLRHGWQSHYTSEEEVIQRLKRAVEVYPAKWMDFIRDSSVPMGYWARRGAGFAIGFKYLVRFLVLAGEFELAAKITEVFVATFVEETEDQPIPEAKWLT